jgi:cytochrome c2
MIFKSLTSRLLLLLAFLVCNLTLQAQDGAAAADPKAGKTLFTNYCASCHNKDMKTDMTGPALAGVQERWAAYPRTDLYSWIRNSQALIKTGHPRANELWNKWKPGLMSNFTLNDAEIESILAYIACKADGSCDAPPPPPPGDEATGNAAEGKNNTLLFVIIAFVLAMFALVLSRILSNLNYMIATKDGVAGVARQSLKSLLLSRGVLTFGIFALVVLGGYTSVNQAVSLGRQQGYEPEQPIKFSHATHAGLHKIDCQYCHDSARKSKHSSIPASNTCMNCHAAIKVGSKHGTAELTKIYASIGFDPKSGKYIENYERMSEDQLKEVFSAWVVDDQMKNRGKSYAAAEAEFNDQWEGIKEALTDPKTGDYKIQGPIEWVRIHNLPDHAYFNHAQHVSVGKVECQTCHGKIQEMEVVQQHSPLSMGWCINCHRQTEVKFDNEYYKSYYAKYHKELQEGTRKKVTVEDIGGLECQKCHY